MKNKFVKGFTLVELLVVIAIIGVLSSVVLSSVQSARTKAADASVKANLAGARTQADLFYDSNSNSYTNVCTNAALSDGTKSIYNQIVAANTAGGFGQALNVAIGVAGTWQTTTCHITATTGAAWAVESPLKASVSGTPSMYCVDSTGVAKTESANLAINAVSCAS